MTTIAIPEGTWHIKIGPQVHHLTLAMFNPNDAKPIRFEVTEREIPPIDLFLEGIEHLSVGDFKARFPDIVGTRPGLYYHFWGRTQGNKVDGVLRIPPDGNYWMEEGLVFGSLTVSHRKLL